MTKQEEREVLINALASIEASCIRRESIYFEEDEEELEEA